MTQLLLLALLALAPAPPEPARVQPGCFPADVARFSGLACPDAENGHLLLRGA